VIICPLPVVSASDHIRPRPRPIVPVWIDSRTGQFFTFRPIERI
jgi:hypothetical protein